MPEPRKKTAKKSLLSQLGKAARNEITRIMEEQDGALSLHEFLKKHWDLFAMWRSPFCDDAQIEKNRDGWRAEMAKRHPEWSPEEIDLSLRLHQIPIRLKESAIARRFAVEDPGELGRGLAVLNRFQDFEPQNSPLEICASGDLELAQRAVRNRCCWHCAIISSPNLHMDVVYGILQRDPNAVAKLVSQFALQTGVRPWLEGIHITLAGIAENRADEVARGLAINLDGLSKMKQKAELEGAVNLTAQGLYRLAEWVSPDLVSQFDAAQPFPWDAEFHAWVQDHPNPLAELDLTDISPVLHDLIVHGKTPAWLTARPEPLYESVLLGGDPKSRELLGEIEQCAGGNGSLKSAKALLAHAPWPLRWNFTAEQKGYLDACRQRIEKAGGQADVRIMEPNQFRFFIPSEGEEG